SADYHGAPAIPILEDPRCQSIQLLESLGGETVEQRQPQEHEHCDAEGGTRDRLPPASASLLLRARLIVTRRAETPVPLVGIFGGSAPSPRKRNLWPTVSQTGVAAIPINKSTTADGKRLVNQGQAVGENRRLIFSGGKTQLIRKASQLETNFR